MFKMFKPFNGSTTFLEQSFMVRQAHHERLEFTVILERLKPVR
jgi:hypothetical protein